MNSSYLRFSRKATFIVAFSIITVFMGGLFVSQAYADTFSITAPVSGAYWRGEQTIKWDYATTTTPLTFSLAYATSTTFSSQINITGESSQSNPAKSSYSWNVGSLLDSANYRIRVFYGSTPSATHITSATFSIDNTAPVTTLATSSLPDSTTGWYKTKPTITLTCTDNLSGCSSINYAWYNATSSAVVTASTTVQNSSASNSFSKEITPPQGDNTLVYYSEDNAVDNQNVHNIETAQSAEFKVDTVAPNAPTISLPTYINSSASTTVSIAGAGNEVGDTVNYTLTDSATSANTVSGTSMVDSSGNISITKDLSSFVDGTVTLTATLTDEAGNTGASTTSTSTKDTVAKISSITSGATTSALLKIGDTIVFTMTPTTTEAGAIVTGSYNGQVLSWSTANSGTTYTATYTVTEGEQDQTSALQISGVTYTDVAGNTSPAFTGTDINDTIDANSPTLTAVSITSSNASTTLATTGNTVTLSFTASEAVGTPMVTIDEQTANVTSASGTDNWTAAYTMTSSDTQGTVPFTIDFTDLAGNAGTQVTATDDSSTVIFDNVKPNAPVITQIGANGNYINSVNVGAVHATGTAEAGSTVSVTLTDSASSPVTTTAVIGTADSSGAYDIMVDASGLADGQVTATVNATDAAGNTSVDATGTATKDVVAPTVSTITTKDTNKDGKIDTAVIVFDEPVKDTTFSASDFTIGGNAVTSISTGITADDDTITLSTTNEVAGTDAKTVAYTPGSATDIAGNALATFSQLLTDGAGPVLLSARTISTTEIDATFSEKIDSNTINTTGSEFTVGGVQATGAAENTDGVITLTVATMNTGATPDVIFTNSGTFTDTTGNEAVTPTTVITTDGVAPTLSGVSIASSNTNAPTGTYAKAGDTVTLNFTSSEAVGTPTVTIDAKSATVVASTTVTNGWTATYVMTSSDTQGTIPFTIDYTDTAGNAGATVTATDDNSAVFFDSVAPVVSAGSNKEVNAQITQNATVTESGSGVATYAWTNESSSVGTITFGSASAEDTTISADTDGTYTLKLTVTDKAGNENSDTMTFKWDTTNPVEIASTPSNGAQNVSTTTNSIVVTFNEPITALDTSKVMFTDVSASASAITGTVTISGNTIVIPHALLSDNVEYRINVLPGAVTDIAGNNLTVNFNHNFTTSATPDTTPPAVPVITTSTATAINANYYTITGTDASDGGQRIVNLYNGTVLAGSAVLASGQTAWSINSALTQGSDNVFTAKAVDAASNTSGASNSVTITEAAPTVVTPKITLSGDPIVTSYTATEAAARFGTNGLQFNTTDATSATVNGASATIDSSGVITAASASDAITLGLHLYTVKVTSSTGNYLKKTIVYQVNADTVTPVNPTIVLYGDTIVSPYTVTEAETRFTDGLQFTMTGATSVTVNGTTATLSGNATVATTTIAKVDATALGLHVYNVIVTSSTSDTAYITVAYNVTATPITPVPTTIALYGDPIPTTAYTATEAATRFADGLQFTMTGAHSVTVNGVSAILNGDTTTATTTIAKVDATTLGLHVYNLVVISPTGDTAYITVAYQVNPVATLGVTSVTASSTIATIGGDFTNGWRWTFNVTVPLSETQFSMEFKDFKTSDGAHTITAANNIRIYSAQSSDASDASHAKTITAAQTLSDPMTLNTDLDPSLPGRQIHVVVEMKVPTGSAGGSYSSEYAVKSL